MPPCLSFLPYGTYASTRYHHTNHLSGWIHRVGIHRVSASPSPWALSSIGYQSRGHPIYLLGYMYHSLLAHSPKYVLSSCRPCRFICFWSFRFLVCASTLTSPPLPMIHAYGNCLICMRFGGHEYHLSHQSSTHQKHTPYVSAFVWLFGLK